MKAAHSARSFARRLLAVVAGTTGSLAGAAENPPAAKPYALFMGVDLSVQHDKKIYHVEDVAGSELKIHVDRQEVSIPTRNAAVNLQVNAGLKLAGESATLDQLHSGPAYTSANDPMRKLQEASRNTQNVAAAQDMGDIHKNYSDINLSVAQTRVLFEDNADAQRNLSESRLAQGSAVRQVEIGAETALSDMTTTAGGAGRAQAQEGSYDAMEVAFKVSSPVELDRPYMVVLFKFHDPAAKPGVDGLAIHAQALDPIDANPRYVRVLKGGLPVGFAFIDCSVHLYNRGREVATNVSDKRVDLSRDETKQYIVMEHVGGHKGVTLGAAAVRGTLPRPRRENLSHDQLTRTLYVKVSPDGTPLGIFTNEACELQIDDSGTTAAVGDVFFRPALQQGKAVEGVARVRLAEL